MHFWCVPAVFPKRSQDIHSQALPELLTVAHLAWDVNVRALGFFTSQRLLQRETVIHIMSKQLF